MEAAAQCATQCDGCGKELPVLNTNPKYYGDPVDGVSVEIAPEVVVNVCATTRYSMRWHSVESVMNPRLPCIRKAWEKARACAGCGEIDFHNPFEGICDDCTRALARAKDLDADAPRLHSLDTSLIASHYPDREVPAAELLKLIADVAAAKGPRSRDGSFGIVLGARRRSAHSGMPSVELDDDQVKAVEALGAAIKAFADGMYHQGRKDGRNLLGQLMTGESSISDFEETHKRWQEEEE